MKKRAVSLFLVVSMSFTMLYPSLSLNDNVLQCVEYEDAEGEVVIIDGQQVPLSELIKAPNEQKKFKLKFLEIIYELCK